MKELINKVKESLVSVLPVTLIIILISFTPLYSLSGKEILVFILSALGLIIGISFFNYGADLSMSPMGENVGLGLSKKGNMILLLAVSFIMGFLITVAEPDLSVLASQVSAVLNGTVLTVFVGIGVGLFLVLAVIKIATHKNLSPILLFLYCLVFGIAALVLENGNGAFMGVAFDGGGVTTGPITVPFLMALGIGVASTLGDKRDKSSSFGIISLCSIGPIIAILILTLTIKGNIAYQVPDYSMSSMLGQFGSLLLSVSEEVLLAMGLLVVFFLLINFIFIKLPLNKLLPMGLGILFTFFGLVIFLVSVNIGFLPVGNSIGQQLASKNSAFVIGFAFVLGFVVVLAEPAIHVLNGQVENVTDGMISKRSMLIALCVGVGTSLALSVVRSIFNFSVLYYLVPGYLISLVLSFFVPKVYTAIAFDSGGVASGPLTSGFILPFVIGLCYASNGVDSVLSNAFGLVAMVAMTPLITIQLLGVKSITVKKHKDKQAMRKILASDDEQIITFN